MNERQKKFVAAYARLGVASQAAIEAGYSAKTARQTANDLLTNPNVQKALAELTRQNQSNLIASAQERQQLLTSLMRSEKEKTSDRLKAVELLGKMQGDFIERVEHSGLVRISFGGKPVDD